MLRYTQDARGGRLTPARLAKNLDPTLTLPDPLQVMESIAVRGNAAAYLRSFQPSHPQFEALRQKLLALRSEARTPEPAVIPDGPVLKRGAEHAQVALLKKRFEVSSSDGSEFFFSDPLDEAVKRFQSERGLVVDGVVGAGTREALNQTTQGNLVRQRQILLNMERWRWLPQDLEIDRLRASRLAMLKAIKRSRQSPAETKELLVGLQQSSSLDPGNPSACRFGTLT